MKSGYHSSKSASCFEYLGQRVMVCRHGWDDLRELSLPFEIVEAVLLQEGAGTRQHRNPQYNRSTLATVLGLSLELLYSKEANLTQTDLRLMRD